MHGIFLLLYCVLVAKAAAATCSKNYTVKRGDNCDAIAAVQGVSSYQIAHLNAANACSLLQVGQSLCLIDTTYNCQPVYTVKSGDSCSAVSTSHNISLTQFLADNPQLGPSTCPIYAGLSVCISPTTPGMPTTSTPPTTTTNPPPPTSTACTRFGTIQSGDSCDAIAQRSSISIYDLQLINPPSTFCSSLIAGSSVCIGSPLVNCSSVYTVTGTEGGCTNIATAHNINLSLLLTLNPNINRGCTNIYAGEVLCLLPDDPNAPPPPSRVCSRTYTITAGDTCTSIAAKASMTNLQLANMNPTLNCNTLVPGQTVCSYNPSLNVCPNLVKVATRDTCFDLAQNVDMSLDEWLSINPGINCDALLPGSVVCSAEGNATLPAAPSGSNPTAVPNCGNYVKSHQCCTQYSVAADLFSSPLCLRANGCQQNCRGDRGVAVPTSAMTPTTTLTLGQIARPTLPPPTCNNCSSTQCCSKMNSCEASDSWFCDTANGCKSNCDIGPPPWSSPAGQTVLELGNFTFPSGDYSATDGNPCGVCNSTTAGGLTSPSGKYCCTQQVQCVPIEAPECEVIYGCLYNCLDVEVADAAACDMSGSCQRVTNTVLHPWAPVRTLLNPT